MLTIYVTCKDEAEAERIARHLIERRLIACANFWPVRSMYMWDGKVEDEREYALVAKTTNERFSSVQHEIRKLHSYELPCIVAWEWRESDEQYRGWARGEV